MKREGNAKPRKKAILPWLLFLVFFIGFIALLIHGDYPRRILARLGIVHPEAEYAHPADMQAVAGWDRCLEQLGVDADVVFLGDSITHLSDFSAYFPDLTICNFGVDADTLLGMIDRVYTLKTVTPEKVFLMGGINSLRKDNFDATVGEYRRLVRLMHRVLNAEIYVISILPIAKDRVDDPAANEIISRFNREIAEIAEAEGVVYIDLAPLYMLDGAMNPEYTIDGVHLTKAGYAVWADAIAEYMN